MGRQKGETFGSELLKADAADSRSDVFVSLAVLTGILLMKIGVLPANGIGDALITFVAVFFVVRLIIEVGREPIRIFCDAQVVDPEEIEKVVMSVDGVKFCHGIRSHGSKNSYFLDLDIGVDPDTLVEYAHDVISHNVKVKLRDAYPNLKYARVQIEPNTKACLARSNSTFKERDRYDHGCD